MSRRQVVIVALLAALAELTLLGAFVFIAEPQRVGHAMPHLHAVDAAYVALPLLLMAAAAATLLAALRQEREHRKT